MEPLSTLALVCNVFDLVERGYKSAKAVKEIYNAPSGQRDQHVQLEELISGMEDVWSQMSRQSSELAQGGIDAQFQDALQKSRDVSESMRSIISECKAEKPGSFRSSTKAAVKSVFRQAKIQEELVKLEKCRDALKLLVIVQTSEEVSKMTQVLHDSDSVQQELKRKLQTLLDQLTLDRETNISLNFDRLKGASDEAILNFNAQRILRGFYARNTRYDEVAEASPLTYQWISSNKHSEKPLKNDHYSLNRILPAKNAINSWLRTGSGIFHFAGKPGCGKSTLMKHMVKRHETDKLLKEWAGSKPLITVKFFFWKPGDWRQNTLRGLKTSIVADVLRAVPALTRVLFPRIYQKELVAELLVEEAVVEPEDIEKAFSNLLGSSDALKPYMLCIFLDGLDEFKESSEHINHSELAKYVQHSLREDEQFKVLQSHEPDGCNRLIQELADRADGVFLWVSLVVKSIQRGLTNRDPVSKLRSRIQKSPKELGDLFNQILSEIDENYQREVYILLAIALTESWDKDTWRDRDPCVREEDRNYPFISLLAAGCLLNAIDSETDLQFLFEKELETEIGYGQCSVKKLEDSRTLISGRFLGLLEVVDYDYSGQGRKPHTDQIVKFLHRSIPEHLHAHVSSHLKVLSIDSNTILNVMAWVVRTELRYFREGDHASLLDEWSQNFLPRGIRTIPRVIYLTHWAKVTSLLTQGELQTTTWQLFHSVDEAILATQSYSQPYHEYIHYAVSQRPSNRLSGDAYGQVYIYRACLGQLFGIPGCLRTIEILLNGGFPVLGSNGRQVTLFDCLWLWIIGLLISPLDNNPPDFKTCALYASDIWSTLEAFIAHGFRPTSYIEWILAKQRPGSYRIHTGDLVVRQIISHYVVDSSISDSLKLNRHTTGFLASHIKAHFAKAHGDETESDRKLTIEFADVVKYYRPENIGRILMMLEQKSSPSKNTGISTSGVFTYLVHQLSRLSI